MNLGIEPTRLITGRHPTASYTYTHTVYARDAKVVKAWRFLKS